MQGSYHKEQGLREVTLWKDSARIIGSRERGSRIVSKHIFFFQFLYLDVFTFASVPCVLTLISSISLVTSTHVLRGKGA